MLRHFELDREPRYFYPKILNPQLYHLNYLAQGLTAANFCRNQLSPDSIGFSPLAIGYKNACTQQLFGPPRYCYRFTLPTARSSGFGSYPSDLGIFIPSISLLAQICFRSDYLSKTVSLATQINSLIRYSKRTIQLLRAVSYYNHQVSGSFYSLSRVLFNFPSQYLFAIGLSKYLELEVDASHLPAQFPMSCTLEIASSF